MLKMCTRAGHIVFGAAIVNIASARKKKYISSSAFMNFK